MGSRCGAAITARSPVWNGLRSHLRPGLASTFTTLKTKSTGLQNPWNEREEYSSYELHILRNNTGLLSLPSKQGKPPTPSDPSQRLEPALRRHRGDAA